MKFWVLTEICLEEALRLCGAECVANKHRSIDRAEEADMARRMARRVQQGPTGQLGDIQARAGPRQTLQTSSQINGAARQSRRDQRHQASPCRPIRRRILFLSSEVGK